MEYGTINFIRDLMNWLSVCSVHRPMNTGIGDNYPNNLKQFAWFLCL